MLNLPLLSCCDDTSACNSLPCRRFALTALPFSLHAVIAQQLRALKADAVMGMSLPGTHISLIHRLPCDRLPAVVIAQQLRALEADAVMGMALPGSDPTGDSCGCMLSHALGIHSVVVNGCPLLHAPLNVPQVRCRPASEASMMAAGVSACCHNQCCDHFLHMRLHKMLASPLACCWAEPYAVSALLLVPTRPVQCTCGGAPHQLLQMGTGNTPQDLSTAKGFAKNLAVWSLHQAAPLAIELIGSPWLKARRDLGLPRVHSQCPLVNAVAWLRRQAAASCTPVVETALTSWLLEYPRPLPPHQVRSSCCIASASQHNKQELQLLRAAAC